MRKTVVVKNGKLRCVRLLEARLKDAAPNDAGKLAKELVRFKDDWLNG